MRGSSHPLRLAMLAALLVTGTLLAGPRPVGATPAGSRPARPADPWALGTFTQISGTVYSCPASDWDDNAKNSSRFANRNVSCAMRLPGMRLNKISAQVMRRILVDHARSHNVKRGAGVQHVSLEEVAVVGGDRTAETGGDLVALDDALNALARLDPRKVQIIEMRFFGGLSVEETAEVLKVSPATVRRDWSIAKFWLYRELARTGDGFGTVETTR